jgi:hypothetical protein
MPLWGSLDAANNAPKQSDTSGYGGSTPQVTSNGQVYYANTKINAFIANAAIGIFGVDTTEQQNALTASYGHPQHSGWVLRKVGTGPILSITANAGATGVNSYITITKGDGNAGSGNTAANAQISVNTAGYITTITINNPGSYANTPIATPNTGNAVFTVTMGGRANRVQTETLVAIGPMTGDGDPIF